MLLLAPDTIVTTGAGGVTVTRPIPDAGFTPPSYPAAPPQPVAPAYNPGPAAGPSSPAFTPTFTPYTGPLEIVTAPGGGGGLIVPVIPANIPPANPDNALLVNQTYNCGTRCGSMPLPSPGGAAGALNVSAAGSQLGGIPWWVWLVMALLVVLVLAKK